MNARTDRLDALLGGPEPAFCEQIICLCHDPRDTHWWMDLLEEGATVFDAAGRIRTAKLGECRAEVEQSVSHGYRPLLFVPRPMDWPAVYDEIGRYRSFARLYIYGRDDQAMRRLLQAPSTEVLEAHVNHRRLLVPDLAYGKALDRRLPVSLDDFAPAAHGPEPRMADDGTLFVSRFNPFRLLRMRADEATLSLTLTQSYRTDGAEQRAEPCEAPISFAGIRLLFPAGECVLGADQETLAAAVLASLSQPATAQRPWLQVIARELRQRGDAYLSAPLQAALAGMSKSREALAALWACLGDAIAQTTRPRRPGVQVLGAPPRNRTALALGPLVTRVHCASQSCEIEVIWPPGQAPSSHPVVQVARHHAGGEVEIGREQLHTDWWSDLSGVSLRIDGLDLKRPEVSWRWDALNKILYLRLREQPKVSENGT
jgi:hypothetical protein